MADFFTELAAHRKNGTIPDFYDKYANNYDDVMTSTNYSIVQEHVAKCLRQYISKESHILDVGCGTGLSGVHLRNAGFEHIDGTDVSNKSLEVALTKDVYSKVFEGTIANNSTLPCQDNAYNGVACIGCVSKGTIEMRPAVEEFCRIIKPGGYAAYTINAVRIGPFEMMSVLGEAMNEEKVELIMLQQMSYFNDHKCFCCVMKIL